MFGILEGEGKDRDSEGCDGGDITEGSNKRGLRGGIIYTDKFKAYDGLVICGFKHERIDRSIKFSNGKVYINGVERFWSYARVRLLKFHGVSREYFVYYLKELEFSIILGLT